MRILHRSCFVTLRGMPRPARRTAVSAMWVGVLMSSVVLAEMHWAAALATIGLGAIGTLSIVLEGEEFDGGHGDEFNTEGTEPRRTHGEELQNNLKAA